MLPLLIGAASLCIGFVASGFATPPASAYYLVTSEAARNARAPLFPRSGWVAAKQLRTTIGSYATTTGKSFSYSIMVTKNKSLIFKFFKDIF